MTKAHLKTGPQIRADVERIVRSSDKHELAERLAGYVVKARRQMFERSERAVNRLNDHQFMTIVAQERKAMCMLIDAAHKRRKNGYPPRSLGGSK